MSPTAQEQELKTLKEDMLKLKTQHKQNIEHLIGIQKRVTENLFDKVNEVAAKREQNIKGIKYIASSAFKWDMSSLRHGIISQLRIAQLEASRLK